MTPKANMFVLQQERRSHQFLIQGLGALVLAALLVWVGCDSNEAEPEGDDAVELNLETLEAETEHGTLEAERVDDSYVTAMGEGRALAHRPVRRGERPRSGCRTGCHSVAV